MKAPDRYDPRARSVGGPWKMVKCKDGPYVDFEQHQEIVAALAAENERLRKAGDFMFRTIDENITVEEYEWIAEIESAWNAAKEGGAK